MAARHPPAPPTVSKSICTVVLRPLATAEPRRTNAVQAVTVARDSDLASDSGCGLRQTQPDDPRFHDHSSKFEMNFEQKTYSGTLFLALKCQAADGLLGALLYRSSQSRQ